MILVRNLRLGIDEPVDKLKRLAAKEIGVPERDILSLKITKKSLDARKKNDIHWLYAVAVKLKGEEHALKKSRSKNACPYEKYSYEIPKLSCERRPVIVGFGPAGMFAALVLSKAGLRPIVIERGRDAEARAQKVEHFRSGGELDPECNVQFGEGGAGTFSDGKLNTGIKDKRIIWMLEQFVEHGAPEHILYDAKPHIGTDILINVVQSIRKTVIANGGEVRFSNKLTGLIVDRNRLTGIEVSSPDGAYTLECDSVILAIGHSARDTFEMLDKTGVPMQPKAFSMGARIEHKQADIDLAQYGAEPDGLPAADYSLNVHFDDGESAYTFCMCPGGEVIAAASEEGGVVTNGMSRSSRDGENANAALLVTLTPDDFPYDGVLGGMYWQREIEKKAYEIGHDYKACAQTVGDFLARTPSTNAGSVTPSYKPGVHWGDIRSVLPEKITCVMERAIPELGKKLKGFDAPDAVLTAPETRSSSPVRILRDVDRRSEIRGLYPCGEGAGYAGGITSAAVDGMKCAESLISTL
ncbi:MAG: NAD(P)/FAD-dependent oxidoreductase [Oscillospiraceae bacterium]